MLRFYLGFEINDYTGLAMSDEDMSKYHYENMQRLQATAFKHFPELKKLAFSSIVKIDSRAALTEHLSALTDERLREFCERLHLLGPKVCKYLQYVQLPLLNKFHSPEFRWKRNQGIHDRNYYYSLREAQVTDSSIEPETVIP